MKRSSPAPFRSNPERDKLRAKRGFSSAETILQSALAHLGVDGDIARYKFVQHWKEIVGESVACRTRPESLRNGILKIRVSDSTWAQELVFHKQAILKRLGKFVSEKETPRDVQFFVGQI